MAVNSEQHQALKKDASIMVRCYVSYILCFLWGIR